VDSGVWFGELLITTCHLPTPPTFHSLCGACTTTTNHHLPSACWRGGDYLSLLLSPLKNSKKQKTQPYSLVNSWSVWWIVGVECGAPLITTCHQPTPLSTPLYPPFAPLHHHLLKAACVVHAPPNHSPTFCLPAGGVEISITLTVSLSPLNSHTASCEPPTFLN